MTTSLALLQMKLNLTEVNHTQNSIGSVVCSALESQQVREVFFWLHGEFNFVFTANSIERKLEMVVKKHLNSASLKQIFEIAVEIWLSFDN